MLFRSVGREDLDRVAAHAERAAHEVDLLALVLLRHEVGEQLALVELQYRRNELDFSRGAFRAKGDTVEIFPAHLEDKAWRLSMFGDEIEAITEFDPLTGQKTGELKSVKIYANSHYVTPRPTLNQAIKSIKEELKFRLDELTRAGRCVASITFAMVKVLPEPVTPSST